MASVYRSALSVDGGFEKEVAVKVIRSELASDPVFTEMFQDEARISARLTHANLVHTFDFGQVGGTFFLAMEYVRGRTLANLLRTCLTLGKPLGIPLSIHVVAEVARGLGFAHRLEGSDGSPLGLVHRDVSPQNVLISREGEVKLADFGIAKAAERTHVTQPGKVRGKCAYMAPEQARGLGVDARTDVFALGILLWECLARRPLFDGPSDGAVLLQVIQKDATPPSRFDPDVPPELDELVLGMLSRDPGGRPANGDEVARELAALNLRLVQSLEQIDLAGFLRRLSTGTAAWPRVPAPVPRERSGEAAAGADQGQQPTVGAPIVAGPVAEEPSGDGGPIPVDPHAATLVRSGPGDMGEALGFETKGASGVVALESRDLVAEEAGSGTHSGLSAIATGGVGGESPLPPGSGVGSGERAGLRGAMATSGDDAPLQQTATAPGAAPLSAGRSRRGSRSWVAVLAGGLIVGALGWLALGPLSSESGGGVGTEGAETAQPGRASAGVPQGLVQNAAPTGGPALQAAAGSPATADGPPEAVTGERPGLLASAGYQAATDGHPEAVTVERSGVLASAGSPAAIGLPGHVPDAASPAEAPATGEGGSAHPQPHGGSAPVAEQPPAPAKTPLLATGTQLADGPRRSGAGTSPESVQRQGEKGEAAAPRRATSLRDRPTGTLILSSKMAGEVAVVIDGGQRVEIAPHVPIPISVPVGRRRLVFELGKNGLRCVIPAEVEPSGRHPLQLQADGQVVRLTRDGRTPIPCGS